jgi:hypothetical protein
MNGPFYIDSLPPWLVTDVAAVTLATTDKAIYPAAAHPNLGGQFFGFPGKGFRIRAFGRMTTGATPGNLQWDIYWGTGADANGTLLASSAAIPLVINGTSLSWWLELDVVCRSVGATGTLFATGKSDFNVGLVASTNAPVLIPGSLPVVSGAVDLTANNIVSVQFKRSGSTGESLQVHNLWFTPLN